MRDVKVESGLKRVARTIGRHTSPATHGVDVFLMSFVL